MVGLANNRGGKIIFGIQDSPRIPIGLNNDKFENCDPKKINEVINNYFSHEFEWELSSAEFNRKYFGIITIRESARKPIICSKSQTKQLREGAIYYRYRGETKEIAFAELTGILEKEREKERNMWMNHIEKIKDLGPQNIHLVDTFNGEIHLGNEKVLLDSSLLKELKFIKEGKFVERDGAPTLTIRGELTGLVENGKYLPTDKSYPYQFNDLKKMFDLNQHQLKCLIYKLNIKDNPKYHESIKTGKNSNVNKYSSQLIDRIKAILKRYPNYVDKACKEFKNKST